MKKDFFFKLKIHPSDPAFNSQDYKREKENFVAKYNQRNDTKSS